MFTAFARTIILYFVIVVGIRLMGKRQIGELEPSELVVSLLIADLASVPMQDPALPLHTGIIPIITLLSITMILSMLTLKSIKFRTLLCGQPTIIIRNGTIDQGGMGKTRLTIDELLEELRNQGYTDLSTIQYAILETNGMLSVLPCAAEKPVTAQQLGLTATNGGLPLIIISDGRLIHRNLKARGHDLPWLQRQLLAQGCTHYQGVFLFTIDESGTIFCAKKQTALEELS